MAMTIFLSRADSVLKPGARLSGLPDGALAWLLAGHLCGPAWVILPDQDRADRFLQALRFHLESNSPQGVPSSLALPYPQDDLPPYTGLSPSPFPAMERILALDALARGQRVLVVTCAAAILPMVLAPHVLASASLQLEEGGQYRRRKLLESFMTMGYLVTPSVEDPGTCAVRGEVLDIWPAGHSRPLRLDFFDQELESLHSFDPETQRSTRRLPAFRLLPAREWILHPESIDRFVEQTRAAVGGGRAEARLRRRRIETLKAGLSFAGMEDWLPALHPVVSPLETAPGSSIVLVEPESVFQALKRQYERAIRRYADLLSDEKPLVPPRARFTDPALMRRKLSAAPSVLSLPMDGTLDMQIRDNTSLQVKKGNLEPLASRLRDWLDEGWLVSVVARRGTEMERLQALFQPYDLPTRQCGAGVEPRRGHLNMREGELPMGFHAPADRVACLSSDELLGKVPQASSRRHASRRSGSLSWGSLKEGDLVVHSFHGIGLFRGMARLLLENVEADLLKVEYRGGDILYVPVHKLDLLSRYKSATEGMRPKLDRLGGQTWRRRKTRIKDAMLRTAHDLLQVYARRQAARALPMPAAGRMYRRFEAAFPFVETPDQQRAIDEVLQDLDAPGPMDRVVVGDVGFGKTEVAMRAAARVVEAGRQVAVLCPTTVLAYQHMGTWSERFEGFQVSVGMLSRMTPGPDSRQLLEDLREGRVQVVIGTTRLLSRVLRFKNLGLVIVDEEHRFGVRQKERLKQLRAEVHVLSLSATPIPRTLGLAMTGLRAFSTIATPPQDRLAVRTHIASFKASVIRDEIMRELARGGQIFFVHNRVRSIAAMEGFLSRLVPEATMVVTHGQMPPRQLEEALVAFVRRQADILLTTSIIESGVDIPNVNCAIINRADRFGLAQLYQIRGRVGRSFRRARCLLLVPAQSAISRKATRRLRVLHQHQELGAGFHVAQADLEQRGPGTILGENQHGRVDAVGLDTYMELLGEAVAEARGEMRRKLLDPEVQVPLPAYLPESFIPGVEERLEEYRRLSLSADPAQLRQYLDTLEQRFGRLPVEVMNLGWLLDLRLRCRALGVERLTWMKVQVELQLADVSTVSHQLLLKRQKQLGQRMTMPERDRVRIRFSPEEAQYPYRFLDWVLRLLEQEPGA